MEKRVFSLSNTSYQRLSMFNAVGWTFFWLMNVSIREGAWWWVSLAMLVTIPPAHLCRYFSERSRCLELSDEGLELRLWLRKPVRFRWDAITKVEVFEKPSFWTVRPFLCLVARDSSDRDAKISVYRPAYDELASALKQHLPESVFTTR